MSMVAERRRMTRKELREPDEFVEFMGRLAAAYRARRRQVLTAAAVAGVLALSLAGWRWASWASQIRARRALDGALSSYHGKDYEKALAELSEVVVRWPGTRPGRIAALYVGHTHLKRSEYDKAAAAYEEFLRSGRDKDYLYQQALWKAGEASEAGADLAKALDYYGRARSLGGPYEAEALLATARCQEKMGQAAEAAKTYAAFFEQYPESAFAEVARSKASVPAAKAEAKD